MPQVNVDQVSNHIKCPHCKQGVLAQGMKAEFGKHPCPPTNPNLWRQYTLTFLLCPLCGEAIMDLLVLSTYPVGRDNYKIFPLYPKQVKYDYAPKEVPLQYAKDYNEAVQILDISANASSAMSRRCLQGILQHELKIKRKGSLDDQIDAYIKTNPPSYIKDTLHRIRKAGNLGVHPFKHKTTGEIIDATPEIAEYTIVALQKMFDLLFVEPAKTKAQEAEIDKLYEEKSK